MRRSAFSPELSLALLDSLFAQSPVGIGSWDRELRYVRLNEALAEINGIPVEEHIGRSIPEVLPDLDADVVDRIRGVLETGQPILEAEVSGETPAQPGVRRTWRGSFFPVRTDETEIVGVGGVVHEITEEKRALEGEAELQRELAKSNATLREVIQRVPVAIALHWGPELRLEFINERYHEVLPDRGPVIGRGARELFPEFEEFFRSFHEVVFRTGQTIEIGDYPMPFPDDPRSFEGNRHYSATLLRVEGTGGDDNGVLVVFQETTDEVRRRRRLEQDLEEEHRIAHTLQQSLRPRSLPEVPGVELAAKFLPAGRRNEVGGDFYDVFEAPEGAWLLILGDVCGKGADAATVTSLARHTLRTAGLFTGEPPSLLAILNESMMRAEMGMRFCTAICARLDVTPDEVRLGVASAGHCLPLLVRADGTVHEVGSPGLLLGVGPTPRHDVEEVSLLEGDALVLYTDGVTDAGAPDRFLDEPELRRILSEEAGLPAEEILERLARAAVPDDHEPRDDIAMLAVRRPPRDL